MKRKAVSLILLITIIAGLNFIACTNKHYHGVPVPLELSKTTFKDALDQFACLEEYGRTSSSELDLLMVHNRLKSLFGGVEFACYASHQNSFADAWDFYGSEKCVGMSRILNPGKLGFLVVCEDEMLHNDPRALIALTGDQNKVAAIIVPLDSTELKDALRTNLETLFKFGVEDYQQIESQSRAG